LFDHYKNKLFNAEIRKLGKLRNASNQAIGGIVELVDEIKGGMKRRRIVWIWTSNNRANYSLEGGKIHDIQKNEVFGCSSF
jgi:hypothetical protein